MIPPEFTLNCMEKARRLIVNIARRRCLHMNPRRWSNAELRKLCAPLEGDVVNVSGFMDQDKENGHYKDFFPKAASYTITNYAGSGKIGDGAPGSIYLDLEADLDPEMEKRFDVALCHTVLEHIEHIQPAFMNLSHLTREVLIVVVPFLQDEHYSPGIFGDYWRYTPMGLQALYRQHGFEMVYCAANDTPWYPVYLTAVGMRHPDRQPAMPPSPWGGDTRIGRQTYVYPKGVW